MLDLGANAANRPRVDGGCPERAGLAGSPVFVDFEASSLDPESWPVEIGLAWMDGGRLQTRAVLIAQRREWSMAAWSDVSARVHGISPADLREGMPADRVAAATDWLFGRDVISDNPGWDQLWLDRLRAGRAPRIRIIGLREAIDRWLDDAEASALGLELFRSTAPHRAGPDAARLARAWTAARRSARRAA